MMAEASGSRPVPNTECMRRFGAARWDRAPVRIFRCLLLLILTPELFLRNHPRAALSAAGDLLPDTSRTTGVLGVAIEPARPHPEGIAALETRGMCSTNERCREKSMR